MPHQKLLFTMSGEIAQPVEQRPEKPCVPSSILGFATIFFVLNTAEQMLMQFHNKSQ